MAITKSAKKALRQNIRRRKRNTEQKRNLKGLLKEIKNFIAKGQAEEAKKLLSKTQKFLDKAAKTGLIKKGQADRKKSRITQSIAKIKSQ